MNWKSAHILFKYPARGRRDKFFSTLQSYYDNLINKDDFEFIISIDDDDHELNNSDFISAVESMKNAKVIIGPSKGKITAINRDIERAKPWSIIVLVSDDMIPVKKGFDMIIRKDMNKHFPDTDGVLWYNDGHQGNKLNTLCILGKVYYERFGYIYHNDYLSLYCDNEFTEVSKRLNKVRYESLCTIEHQHWAWGYGKMDDLYTRNEKYIQQDHDTFQRRAAIGFELPIAA